MSDATLQAVHDAIAAHIADVSDGEVTAAAALASNHDRTMYFNVGTNAPYHHRLGLMYRGLELLEGADEDDD